MTVTELLARIMAAYPGATPAAMESFTPVFHARFRNREGAALEAAALEVLGGFKPTSRQPFPIPRDFDEFLPNHPKIVALPGIGPALQERARRRHINTQNWLEGQGLKIKQNRPLPVYAACLGLALELCQRADWKHLSPQQIAECEQRALSQTRVRMFGRLPATNEAWDMQMGQVRQAWAAESEPVEAPTA
jgi:hypothetical protein